MELVGVFDSHYPHTIPLEPLYRFLRHRKPKYFVLGGDNLSMDCISHWNSESFKRVGFDRVKYIFQMEIAGFKKQLDTFRRILPKSEIVYITGNHEDWIRQFCDLYPQMRDMTLESLLEIKKLDIELIPFGGKYKIGKLYIQHGHEYGTENPAKQALMRTHKSVAMGHHHNQIMWSDFSDIDEKEKHVAMVVPCYAKLAPGYGKGRPNRWTNGFLDVQFEKSGYFYATIQHVRQDGHFITPDGKRY